LLSSSEEYEPDDREGQDNETSANDQHVSYVGPSLGLPGFLRGFDDLLAMLECHDAIPPLWQGNERMSAVVPRERQNLEIIRLNRPLREQAR
jgi:hypothetical protein